MNGTVLCGGALVFLCSQEVLLDDQIVKLGVNIGGDVIKLAADYGTQVRLPSCLHAMQCATRQGRYPAFDAQCTHCFCVSAAHIASACNKSPSQCL